MSCIYFSKNIYFFKLKAKVTKKNLKNSKNKNVLYFIFVFYTSKYLNCFFTFYLVFTVENFVCNNCNLIVAKCKNYLTICCTFCKYKNKKIVK